MQTNNNLSPLPFYQDITEQDYRKWYAYGDKYLHRVPSDYLVPFFHRLPDLSDTTDEWSSFTMEMYRVCECGDEPLLSGGAYSSAFSMAFNINAGYESKLISNGLSIKRIGNADYLMYFANRVGASRLDMPRGVYYIKFNVVSESEEESCVLWSDLFVAEPNINDYIRIEWRNIDNLPYEGGVIPYNVPNVPNQFCNIVYLDSDISMPSYEYTEEGEERNGIFYPTKQISEKVYNMSFTAPEYLCDVMRLIPMSDYVTITDKSGRTYRCSQFSIETSWLEGGHYANAKCSFRTDTIVRKTGKAYSL